MQDLLGFSFHKIHFHFHFHFQLSAKKRAVLGVSIQKGAASI